MAAASFLGDFVCPSDASDAWGAVVLVAFFPCSSCRRASDSLGDFLVASGSGESARSWVFVSTCAALEGCVIAV